MSNNLIEIRQFELKCLTDLASVLDYNTEWLLIYRMWLTKTDIDCNLDENILLCWLDNFVIKKYIFDMETYINESINDLNRDLKDEILYKLKEYI